MSQYVDHEAFQALVLEESYVLGIVASPAKVEFTMDLALAEDHPLYSADRPARNGVITFVGVRELTWRGQGLPAAVDASGERDFGAIDALTWEGERFALEGDWGTIQIEAAGAEVVLADDERGAT